VFTWLKSKAGLQGQPYAKEVAQLQEQLKKRRNDPKVKLQLAEVLIQAKRIKEAAGLLESVADDFALQGMAARAIAVLKRLDKLEPGNPEVEEKLAYLISQEDNPMPSPWRDKAAERSRVAFEIGMEEITEGGVFEMGMDVEVPAEIPAHLLADPIPAPPAAAAPEPPPVSEPSAPAAPLVPAPAPKSVKMAPARPAAPAPPPPAPIAVPPSPAPAPGPRGVSLAASVAPSLSGSGILPPLLDLTDEGLVNELLNLVEVAFAKDEPAAPAAPGVVASPLFSGFRPDELMALIRGLELRAFDPGEIVVAQGEPGESLFVLTSGSARAYMKDGKGKSRQVREMHEGDVFGEIAVMLQMPRTATVTAATRCEALELDRPTLEKITKTHPRVREVLQSYYSKHMSGA
jgi:hypothetical protein